jgi:PAS domain S-box-containing protein
MALLVGIAVHVTSLRSTTLEQTRRRFASVAANAARMVDLWIAERDGDARSIAEIVGVHGSDSTNIAPAIAGRILRLEMESLRRRGGYPGIWLVNTDGQVLGSVGGLTLTAAEANAAEQAISTRSRALGIPEQRDSTTTIGVATPIIVDVAGTPQVQAAVVFRADLNRLFSPVTPTVRPPSVPVIVVPAGRRLLGISLCPMPAVTVCVAPVSDTLARRALATAVDDFAPIDLSSGVRVFTATHRAKSLPWSVYYAVEESVQFAPVRERLRFEAMLLAGVLLVVVLAWYAYDRSINLRRVTERAQTEARFAAIVNTAMDAIIIVSDDYKIAVVNSAAERMFGYPAQDAVGRSVLELIPGAAEGELQRTLEHALRATGEDTARVVSTERYAAGRRRDTSTFPVDLSVSRTQIDGRAFLTVVIRDVTDWKRAEETSEWQRRVLEAIATGVELPDVLASIARFHETQCVGVDCAIHLINDDGLTLRVACAPSMHAAFVAGLDEIVTGPNAATCGAAAYRREQIITDDIASDALWNDYRTLAAEHGYRSSWATPIRSPQGRLLGTLALYARESRAASPHALRVTASATQLAGIAVDRARAAESLSQSEASFRSFVENSPIGIYRATSTGRLLAVNASLVQLLGYESPRELLQIDLARGIFVSATDRDRLLHQLETKGELRSYETEWRRKDGATVTVRISARAYRDERGSLWFSEGFVENVSPLRAAEQALRQSEKLAALGQLVSGVAHELNNPLAAILHFAEDLLDDERTTADLEALSVIRDQARRSRSIVRDLSSFVRSRDYARERVRLTDALTTSVRALQPVVDELGARLMVELPTSEVVSTTDRAGLQQIVTNLVVNAAQASGHGGAVSLRATISHRELTIVVEDSGPGIPPAAMDRIFEPFFTTKPLGEGTGLGLSVTLGIVQHMGGRITVENRLATDRGGVGVGGGARFTVSLPVDADGAQANDDVVPSTVPAAIVPTTGAPAPRVLIIDDEPSIRAALRRFFTRRGWQVDEAEDGSEGLLSLLTTRFEYTVIISDLKMPGCSGVELHDHIAAVAPELLDRIVFSTGDVASRDAAAFVQRTRCPVVQKPFELRALESIVARMRQMATA